MRKFLTFLLLMVLVTPQALRADEVIIGDGTSTSYTFPFNNYYGNSYNESIYQASEIGTAGFINSVAYHCGNPKASQYVHEMRIYMGEVDRTVHNGTGDWVAAEDLTLVYTGTNFNIGGSSGWQTFELDEPYLYEGEKNLVIVIGKKGSGWSMDGWNYTVVPNTVLYRFSDSNGDSFLVHPGGNTGKVSGYRANVKMDISPADIDCFRVKSVAGVESTARTIAINWVPAEGQTAWDVYVSLDGNAPNNETVPTASNVTETQYTFTGLTPNTSYKIYVRGNCGESVSAWRSVTYRTGPDFGGNGTAEDPYQIYSLDDLRMLTDVMKLGYNTTGKHFIQMNDIDGVNFCIGDGATIPFKGTYDGNGYAVDINLSGNYDQGFFKTLGHGATVKNLTITGKAETNGWQTGGVVAVIELSGSSEQGNIYIDNCVNRATISSKGNNVGGIISDFNINGDNYLIITNCVNYGAVSAPSSGTAYAGGIGGRFQKNTIVNNCVNYGEITGLGYIGGIVAYPRTNVVIANSVNKGNINGTNDRIGGISGYSSGGSILNSYNVGKVTGNNYIGGIIGRLKGGNEGQGVLQNVYNAGQVVSSSNDTQYSGAVLGYNEGDHAAVTYAYYLEGVYGQAYGTAANAAIISNVSSFTQNPNQQTNFILANEIAGTTNLIDALNSYSVEGRNEWLIDIYGNNGYYPTFVVGNPPGIEFFPSPFAMGARPIGAKMHAEKIEMKNTGSVPVEVTLLDLENSAFLTLDENSPNPELPVTIEPGKSVDIYVTTKADAEIEEGEIATRVVAMWDKMNRLASVGEITATAYVPSTPDVIETAQVVNSLPYNTMINSSEISNNYILPGDKPESNDAVFEINITEDVLLNASVDGANNKIALYTEDLYGEQFPGEDNYYKGIHVEGETEIDFFYFNQSEMITSEGTGPDGSDVSRAYYTMGANINKQWYLAADDFYYDEDFTVNEMEFYAYQNNAPTDQSTITGLYVEIYDGNPMEGGQVIWGNMNDNILSYSNWTGIYRTDQWPEYIRPIMRVVATDLNIELPAGTYWVAVGMTGSLYSGPYAVQRTILGEGNTGNALLCNQGTWANWNDNGAQPGLAMIIREGTSNRDVEMARTAQATFTGEPSAMIDEISEQGRIAFENNRGAAPVYGGDDAIENVTLRPGKYYVVASSSSAEFGVNIETETIPVPEVPVIVSPEDFSTNVTGPVELRWTFGQYTTEYQLLVGGAYPPTDVVVDWTSDLAAGYTLVDVNNNMNYFWQVKARNSSGVTEGPIWAFTTTFNIPTGLTIDTPNLYPGESALLMWNPMQTRSHRGYNIYQDGVKINKELVTDDYYFVDDLTYNMQGYTFEVTAVYDEGESDKSNAVKAYMTGEGTVEGYTYEQDGVTPIAGVTVTFTGNNEFGKEMTSIFTSDENGYYTGSLFAGNYSAETSVANYQNAYAFDIKVEYDVNTPNVNFNIYETYNPVAAAVAEEIDDNNVNVYWSWDKIVTVADMIDFETGDFSQADFNNEVTPDYPWVISETAYEGNYAIKSSCEGVNYGESIIEITVEVPEDGVMSYYHKVSSEQAWDLATFYIDDVPMTTASGEVDWTYKEFAITAGTHKYTWRYSKDVSMESGQDAFWIDNITLYKQPEPFTGGWLHYDDGAYASSIGTGQPSPCYWGVSFPDTEEYAGYSVTKLAVYDAAPDYAGTYTANVYFGGTNAPGTLVSTQEVTLTGVADFVEIELSQAIALDGTQPLWITFYTPNITYPAAGSAFTGNLNSDWISLDGTTWNHASTDYNLFYSWMIRAYLENSKGETAMLRTSSNAPKFEGGASTGTFVAAENVTPRFVGLPERMATINNVDMNRALQSYKVYRMNSITGDYTAETVDLLASEVMDTVYVDTEWGTMEDGVYQWGVAAVYEGNRSGDAAPAEYPFQGDNESPIVWTNTLDKNMVTTVSVNVETNSDDSPAGAVVELINMSEPEMGYDYIINLDETGTYTWNSFRKGTYRLTISLTGFVSSADGEVIEIWDATTINSTLEEITAMVNGLYVSPTGWAMWERPTGETGDEFFYGFETSKEGWTLIDADGDGYDWCHTTELEAEYASSEAPSHTGVGHIVSGSYHWDNGALQPDNYIVTPEKVNIGSNSVFTFWAAAQDMDFAAEHFGVAVSTTGNTSADDFTTIWEETMVAKSTGKTVRDAKEGYGTWYEYRVDLGHYAGQKVYIAIRHFDSFDQFLLRVDDVALINVSDRALESYTVMLNGVEETEITTTYYQHENLIIGEQYTTTVVANYTTGASEPMSYTWEYVDPNTFSNVSGFTAEYSEGMAVLNWTMPGGNNNDDPVEAMSWSFDNDTEGWTTIDANNDSHTWYHTSYAGDHGTLAATSHSGTGHVMSESYCNASWTSMEPDDYFVAPQQITVANGTKFSLWACSQDENYSLEHFGVAVSTAGNTSASDFTTISEWTIGAKVDAKGAARGERDQTTWTKYEADLSEYAGQNVWVAIRHFGCYDQFVLLVDDVEITSGSKDSKEGTWAYYDDGVCVDGIGGPQSFSWGIKLRAADIADLGVLTKISAYDRVYTSGTFDICLGGDNAPGESVLNQPYSFTGSNSFVEFELTEAVNPAGQNVWIVFNTNDGTNYPAAECVNTGDPDGRWIYLDGDGWFDVAVGAGLDATWMIRGYFEEGGNNEETNEEVLGVMLYRDGELLTSEPLNANAYTETLTEMGEYEYCIRLVYGGAMDTTYYAMSAPDCATVEVAMNCDAPENLYAEQAEQNGKSGVSLVWPYSEPVSDWLYYDDGVNQDAIGGPASFYWGIMFPSESLAAYAGASLTKVSLFDYSASSGDILVYYGGTNAPQDLVHSQPYSVNGTGGFVEFDLTAALPIDPTMNVWIAFSTSQGATYPAATCANTGDPNGRWISMDGSVWEDIVDYGLSYTWMMRAYVTNAKGEAVALNAITDYEYTASTGGELAVAGAAKSTRALDHYNVYRGTTTNNFEVITETTEGAYFDELTDSGTYYYQVTAVYVENGEECESDPANAYGSDEDYVSVEFVSIDENGVEGMMIYPNPTKDNVTISAEGIERITITNALGQVMLDRVVNSDSEILNMGQYEAGVYMVRIVTANGVATERITVL